jgi:transposase
MKKLTRRPVRFKGLTVGLDVHKTFIEFVILDRRGDEEHGGRIESSREGLAELLRIVGRRKAQYALEASGSSLWVFEVLADHVGREQVHVTQPHRVRPIANSLEKNDGNDAWWQAYLLFEGRLPEAWMPESDIRELRIATRELRSAVDCRSDLIRRFKSHLTQEGLRITVKNFNSPGARQEAAELAQAKSGARGLALTSLLRQIEHLDQEIEGWRADISKRRETFPEAKVMADEIPGVGSETGAVLIGELGSPTRYRSAKAYACATGLVPGYRESGGRKMAVGMSRAGSRHARWALTRAVVACMRCKRGPGVNVKYWVLRRTRYRPKKAVYVAAARKLAEGIWRLFQLGEEFDLAKAFPNAMAAKRSA